jgi:antitoxin component of MazEF toxin-antitoxin module
MITRIQKWGNSQGFIGKASNEVLDMVLSMLDACIY